MVQPVRAPLAKPTEQSLIPGDTWQRERTNSHILSSDLHMASRHAHAHTYTCIQKHKINE